MHYSKIRSIGIQMLAVIIVFTSVVMIDQHNKALAKTPKTEKNMYCAGMSKALRDMLENPIKVEKVTTKKKKTKKPKINENDLYYLAHVIDGEFRGQADEGKWLVGACVLNRVRSEYYPNTIEEVVKDKKYGIQYACYYDGNFDREPEKSSWQVARSLLENGLGDFPKSVVYQSAAKQGSTYCEYKCTNGVICYFCHNKWIKEE